MRWLIPYLLLASSAMADSSVYIEQIGDMNTVSVMQSGTGSKSADIGMHGDAIDITLSQSGDGNHAATVSMDQLSGNANDYVNIVQSGSADKSFNLSLSGSNIGVTVVQDNPSVADSGGMTIQCYTGSCTGYSYIRH